MVKKVAADLGVHWWALTLRGIATILFGVVAVVWPGLTLVTLVYLLSAFIAINGIINIVEGLMSIGKHRAWVLTLLLGFLQVAVGLYFVRHLTVTLATFILVAGLLFIARGVLEVVVAFAEDGVSATGRTMTILAGVVSFLVGVVLLFQPVASGLAFVWLFGVFALVAGPMQIAMSLDVKKQLEA